MDQELYPESPILVVDDEKHILNSLDTALGIEGITNVECCQDSRDVLPRLKKKRYSLILLDLIMPHIRGEELLPKIIEKHPKIPVIVITADKDIDKAVECLNQGAIDYLVKPLDTPRLLEKVRKGLDFFDKPHLEIAKISTEIKDKKIDKGNVGLFYALGQAYEKIEDYGKAADLYHDIAKFDPNYTGIQKKLEKIEKLKKDIIKIYHKERYEIIEEVGKGAIGVVYKAKDSMLERLVALKILNQSPIAEKRDIESFISEAKKVAKLQHANIVRVYDFGQLENDYFISMEFIEGIHLGRFISDKHPIPMPDILVIAKKLFTALKHSHRNGVIHRDIKPTNIMITYENEVKVLDFGIAVLIDDLRRKERDVIVGTPFYMSPEQIFDSTTDHLTDIYSAGITLFHLVTGTVPFKGSSSSEIMNKHLNEQIPSINEFRNDIPKKLMQIIEKCMAKNKEDRYKSASEVIEGIDGIKDSKGKAVITNKTKLRIFDPVDTVTPAIFSLDEDTQILRSYKEPGRFIDILRDEKQPPEVHKKVLRIFERGGDTAIKVLREAEKIDNEEVAKAASDALNKLIKREPYEYEEDDFIDRIDIPTFVHHLVLSRYASPELLTNINHDEIKKAIPKICPGDKGMGKLAAALRTFEDEYSNQNPNPLWLSWITANQEEKIKEVKEILERMINP